MSRVVEMLGEGTPSSGDLIEDLKFWVRTNGVWWATSATAHAA